MARGKDTLQRWCHQRFVGLVQRENTSLRGFCTKPSCPQWLLVRKQAASLWWTKVHTLSNYLVLVPSNFNAPRVVGECTPQYKVGISSKLRTSCLSARSVAPTVLSHIPWTVVRMFFSLKVGQLISVSSRPSARPLLSHSTPPLASFPSEKLSAPALRPPGCRQGARPRGWAPRRAPPKSRAPGS